MLKKILHTLALLPMLIMTSCADDFNPSDYSLGEGEALVSATVDFHPLVSRTNEVDSRGAAGDALAHVSNLTVFIYNEQNSLVDIVTPEEMLDLKVAQRGEAGSNTDMPNDAGGKPLQAEASTARATFSLKDVPYGRYYIYAVANLGPIEDNEANRQRFSKSQYLRDMQVKWNADDISANNQMFGYFTPSGNDTEESQGFDAPLLTVGQKHVQLHSWIKRAASKVTVVYDGRGLHEDVWVYIQKVTIKDIPLYCKIGNENSVHTTSPDSMIVNGDDILYDANGVLPAGKTQGTMSSDWLAVSRGSGLKGAVSVVDGDTITHSENDTALYFYENLQGNYADAANKKYYDKRQDWNNLGFIPSEGQYDYKDNVPYGTYIEVEAFYNSQNAANVSSGKIIYRFMLGQDVTYDYNALRNHHYKLTLGFKGWANQPDWHIEYIEPENVIYNIPTYYVSYMYNQRSEFPIRLVGDPQELTVEIVENNWAPYDPTSSDSVPKESFGSDIMDFKWNRNVYLNLGKQNTTNALTYPASSGTSGNTVQDATITNNGYYYGLQRPYNSAGTAQVTYTDELAPKYVTPIWAGFLALMVPGNQQTDLPATIVNSSDDWYSKSFTKLKNYFYGKGDGNTIPQNIRTFSKADLTVTGWSAGGVVDKPVGSGNNKCTVTKNSDGSLTVNMPMWTRPKSMLSISGFSGNNPYDTYQRKAMVKITAKFANGTTRVKYMPVFQVRRVVNPKGVWRRWNDNAPFHVRLLRREGADAASFNSFTSEGAWRAYIKTVSPGSDGFITLTGGSGVDGSGAVYGNTDTPIDFNIIFNGKGVEKGSHCAIIEVEYHGFNCSHSIFVRQGYFSPLDVAGTGTYWSSFNLFSCDTSTPFGTTHTSGKYVTATVTASPLSLGTFFRRGNYKGIRISNNGTYGVNQAPGQGGTFVLTDGKSSTWQDLQGYPTTNAYGSSKAFGANTVQAEFEWAHFEAKVDNETRHYRVPTQAEYQALIDNGQFGIGVLYADGATETATLVDDAYGFEDWDNDGEDNGYGITRASSRGMRGFVVYNTSNAYQLFFPLGARGAGRRTMCGFTKTSFANFGTLRYSSSTVLLTGATNSMRPIPYNNPGCPGALFWLNKTYGSAGAWDMNYFDMNFMMGDYGSGYLPDYSIANYDNATHGGDAIPIKLVRE